MSSFVLTVNHRSYLLKLLSFLSLSTMAVALGAIILDIVGQGLLVVDWQFLTASPVRAGRGGGIFPVLVSTAMILGIALAVVCPIGLGTALFLTEYANFSGAERHFVFFVRRGLDVLAGLPSIVFGLFGNAFFCVYLGMGFSILSGGLTLACMVLPMQIRGIEGSLLGVPVEYRTGLAALGFSKTSSIIHLILPTALSGIVAATLLGFARAIAETAALVFTSGYVDRMPESVFDSGRSLSIHIYDLAMNVPGGDRMAYGSSLTLLIVVVTVSVLSKSLMRFFLNRGTKKSMDRRRTNGR